MAEEHHVIKTKDFDIYGKLRKETYPIKTLEKSSAKSELNEKFITTETVTDRRIKVASLASREYMNAPSVQQIRNFG